MSDSNGRIHRKSYLVELIGAGLDGAASARKKINSPRISSSVWAPATIGAAIGALRASSRKLAKGRHDLAAGTLMGGAVGLACGLAWESRAFARTLTRGAIRSVNVVRDAHWLEKNPINYG